MLDEVRDCIERRPGAWDAFVRSHGSVILSAIRRVLSGRVRGDVEELSRDVFQEVFVRLLRDDLALLRRYDESRASLSTWLTIVSRSVAWDALRRRGAGPTGSAVELEDVSERLAGPASDDPARVEGSGLEWPEGLLSPRQALVLHLLFDRAMSVTEAAGLMGVDEQTVRSAKHKALSRLRGHFGGGGGGGDG